MTRAAIILALIAAYAEAEQERRWAEAADRYYADLEAGVAPWQDDDQ